jgi:hypothetical protein
MELDSPFSILLGLLKVSCSTTKEIDVKNVINNHNTCHSRGQMMHCFCDKKTTKKKNTSYFIIQKGTSLHHPFLYFSKHKIKGKVSHPLKKKDNMFTLLFGAW